MKRDEAIQRINEMLRNADQDTVLAVYATLSKMLKKPETRPLLGAIAKRL